MAIITISSVLSLQMQEAYAVVPTVSAAITGDATSGDSTATTKILLTFNVDVNATTTNTAAAWSVAGFTISSVTAIVSNDPTCNGGGAGTSTMTITLTTALATDATPDVTYDGTSPNISIRDCVGKDAFENATSFTPTDGLIPTFDSAATTSTTTIALTYSEAMDTGGSIIAGDYSITDPSVTVSGVSVSGSTVTLTVGTMESDATPTVTQTGDVDDTSANTLSAPSAVVATDGNPASAVGSKGCIGDCSAPTLGVDEQFNRVVENGFTYNGNTINVERYFTPYPLITVDVGKQNKAVFKIYDDSGPDNIRHFDFAFGLDIGQVMGTSNAMIVWNKSTDGTETVTLVDPHNALDNVRVLTSEGKCKADSTTNGCLIVTVFHTFRESLDFDMVGTNVWDYERNGWQNFYNHGIHIEGQSLNPPDEYVGIYKGNLIHLIETGKNTAVDTDGNTWTFDNTWIKDYISIGKIDDPITSQGYDRNHVRFGTYKQGQELVASSLFETYYKTSISQEPAFSEIDDIKFYEFPDRIDKKFDPVLLAKMHQEDIRAQKYLEELFAKIYPNLAF